MWEPKLAVVPLGNLQRNDEYTLRRAQAVEASVFEEFGESFTVLPDCSDPLAVPGPYITADPLTSDECAAYNAAHPPEPERPRPMTAREFLASITGVDTVVDCIKSPTWGGCAAAGAEFIPLIVGKGAKLLSKACSFTGETQVLMADGTTQPLQDIDVGDQVQATYPETGENGARTVTAVLKHQDIVLDLITEDGSAVTTTEDHPYWNATDRQWQEAQHLDPGDQLLTANRQPLRVDGFRPPSAHVATAYNLTVHDINTYYVLAGQIPVLVHNCGGLDDVAHARKRDTYGNYIADGVDYNIQRMCPSCSSAGEAADRTINGIDGNVDGLANYQRDQRDLGMTHTSIDGGSEQ